ncbi:MAG: AAA family ATPase [Chthoniobacteraceae bacterium]
MNTVTKRLFIAATQQNDGKTTVALGIFGALRKTQGRIGFIKPVGQRFVEIEGHKIDEDTVLIDQTYGIGSPLDAISPIAVEPEFTRRFIQQSNSDMLVRRIQNSFDRAAWEKDFVIIEGTGHAGVGSVFDLSNARVAKLLDSKAILITRGGIGRPIDEVALNRAVFEKEGVELLGVIVNKVHPDKYEHVVDFARRGFERLGIELLGAIPADPLLSHPTLGQVCKSVNGEFINARASSRRLVRHVLIGDMGTGHLLTLFHPGMLLITPGDRDDVVLAALSHTGKHPRGICGLVMSSGHHPHESVMKLLRESELPVISSPLDSYSIASTLHSMTVKTLPGDNEKIQRIQSLVEMHVNVARIVEKLAPAAADTSVRSESPA